MPVTVNENLRERIYNLTGSIVAKNSALALIDEETGVVSSTIRSRKENILGLIPTSINSPRIKMMDPNKNILYISESVVDQLNEFWPIILTEDDVREIINMIELKSTYINRVSLLKSLKKRFSNDLTANDVIKTTSILRGASLLSSEIIQARGAALLGQKNAVLGKFVLGDGTKSYLLKKVKSFPGITPMQAREIMERSQKVDLKYGMRGR